MHRHRLGQVVVDSNNDMISFSHINQRTWVAAIDQDGLFCVPGHGPLTPTELHAQQSEGNMLTYGG